MHLLLFPPQFEPFQPYLSLPVLSSALSAKDLCCTCRDYNVEYFRWVLQPDRVCTTLEDLRNRSLLLDTDDEGRAKYLAANIEEAVDVARGDRFYDLPAYRWGMDIIRGVLQLESRRFSPSSIDLYSARMGESNYGSDAMCKSVEQDSENPYVEFIESEVLPDLKAVGPKSVGFSVVVHDQLGFSLTLSKAIREVLPDKHITWGGPLVSRIYRQIAKSGQLVRFVDSMVVGPGEQTLCSLVEAIESEDSIQDIPGLAVPGHLDRFREREYGGGKIYSTPDFSCLPLDKYLSPDLVLPYLTAEGCYWQKCAFCSHHYPCTTYQPLPSSEVVTDVAELSRVYGTPYFSICDEALPPHRLRELCQLIEKRKLDIKWFTFVRLEPDFDSSEFCLDLYNSGCRTLMFGVESFNQQTLDRMNKGTRSSRVLSTLESCKKAGISVRCDLMIGFPGESEEDGRHTLKLLRQNKGFFDTPFSIVPLSIFELQENSTVAENPERYEVRISDRLNGDLDTQFAYSDILGMTDPQKKQLYQDFIDTMYRSFNGPIICPENKTHAFLMKCAYDRNQVALGSVIAPWIDDCQPWDIEFCDGVEVESQALAKPESGSTMRVHAKASGFLAELSDEVAHLLSEIRGRAEESNPSISATAETKASASAFSDYEELFRLLVNRGVVRFKDITSLHAPPTGGRRPEIKGSRAYTAPIGDGLK